MDETKTAQRIWREAQRNLLETRQRLADAAPEEMFAAGEAFKDAMAEVEAAKDYYDEVRHSQGYAANRATG